MGVVSSTAEGVISYCINRHIIIIIINNYYYKHKHGTIVLIIIEIYVNRSVQYLTAMTPQKQHSDIVLL